MGFSDWINDKYIEWRGKTRKTVSDFAKHVGVSQPLMSAWMSGTKRPSTRTLPKLAAKYPDIYGVLGLSLPDSVPSAVTKIVRRLDDDQLQDFIDYGNTLLGEE